MAGLSDTSPEADKVLTEVYRKMPLERKWRLLAKMYRNARALHAAGVRLRAPQATSDDILEDWLRLALGFTGDAPIRQRVEEGTMFTFIDLREVLDVLTNLAIPYAIGGSLAASLHGITRHTNDADLTIDLSAGQEEAFLSGFGPDWYVSLPAVKQAVRQRTSFNLIHTSEGLKVDFFLFKNEPFDLSAMSRRLFVELPGLPGRSVALYGPEDIVLFKLRWFRLGNEVAMQQWQDVINVLKVQAGKLDDDYLARWAPQLGIADLLARARAEACL